MELAEPGKKGALVLEDGTIMQGVGFGAETEISGEVGFNTSMMGYPELLTDPSYQEQIVVMTYPILGSYGVPPNSIRGDFFFSSRRRHTRFDCDWSSDVCSSD